jgi:hypothetical protein
VSPKYEAHGDQKVVFTVTVQAADGVEHCVEFFHFGVSALYLASDRKNTWLSWCTLYHARNSFTNTCECWRMPQITSGTTPDVELGLVSRTTNLRFTSALKIFAKKFRDNTWDWHLKPRNWHLPGTVPRLAYGISTRKNHYYVLDWIHIEELQGHVCTFIFCIF